MTKDPNVTTCRICYVHFNKRNIKRKSLKEKRKFKALNPDTDFKNAAPKKYHGLRSGHPTSQKRHPHIDFRASGTYRFVHQLNIWPSNQERDLRHSPKKLSTFIIIVLWYPNDAIFAVVEPSFTLPIRTYQNCASLIIETMLTKPMTVWGVLP